MNQLSMKELKTLAEYMAPNCVSLYVPTPEVGAGGHMQPAHLHDAIREAIAKTKMIDPEKKETLDAVFNEIANDEEFRERRVAGLAVFIGSDAYWWYSLPDPDAALVVVSNRFHIRPLIPFLTEQTQFYLLSLNKNHIHVFKGDRSGLEEVSVPGLPQSEEAIVGVESDDRRIQFHTSTAGSGGGRRPAQFHGPSWQDDKQKYSDNFLNAINDALIAYLHKTGKKVPLVLAGVERLVVDYLALNKSEYIHSDLTLPGNYEKDTVSQLHEKVMEIIKPFFVKQALEQVTNHIQRGSVHTFSTDLSEILTAARMGRVATLLVAENEHVWGDFDVNTLQINMDPNPTGSNCDLLDVACVETVLTDGAVFVVPKKYIPGEVNIAAVYRY